MNLFFKIKTIKWNQFFLRFKIRFDSLIYEIPNFLNIFQKDISKRIYKTKDPFNNLTLFAPTYRQLKVMQREFYLNKYYYKNIATYFENTKGKTLFDVGANIGYYSKMFSHYCNNKVEIIGIEPNLNNVGFCSMNLRDLNNFYLLHGGFSNCFDRFNLEIPNYAKLRKGESKFNTGLLSAVGLANKAGIRFFIFDEYCKFMRIKFEDISWVKIDVEGFELNVVEGMSETLLYSNSVIEMEINPQTINLSNIKFDDLINYFKNFGYYPLRSKNHQIDNLESKLFLMNILFVKEKSINIVQEIFNFTILSEQEINNWNKIYEKSFR